jgi:hypothetical protein
MSELGRDHDWILAMAAALGTNSGFSVPIVPTKEAFEALFADIRQAALRHAAEVCSELYTEDSSNSLMDGVRAIERGGKA